MPRRPSPNRDSARRGRDRSWWVWRAARPPSPAPALAGPGLSVLRPRSLVVGVWYSTGADPSAVASLVHGTLRDAGLSLDAVAEVASIDRRRHEPAVVELGWPVRTFTAEQLAEVD